MKKQPKTNVLTYHLFWYLVGLMGDILPDESDDYVIPTEENLEKFIAKCNDKLKASNVDSTKLISPSNRNIKKNKFRYSENNLKEIYKVSLKDFHMLKNLGLDNFEKYQDYIKNNFSNEYIKFTYEAYEVFDLKEIIYAIISKMEVRIDEAKVTVENLPESKCEIAFAEPFAIKDVKWLLLFLLKLSVICIFIYFGFPYFIEFVSYVFTEFIYHFALIGLIIFTLRFFYFFLTKMLPKFLINHFCVSPIKLIVPYPLQEKVFNFNKVQFTQDFKNLKFCIVKVVKNVKIIFFR